RWKLTGRLFKTAGLRWIPTGKMLTDCTTKVDSEPLNGSNEDITNPCECDKTLNVSAETRGSRNSIMMYMFDGVCKQHFRPRSSKKRKYFKPPPNVDHPVPKFLTPVLAALTSSPSLTTVDQDAPSTKPSSKETTLQGVIPS
ncbi:hypothetical protein Tco_1361677, partial [Tanacetum coccineum]